MNTQTRDYLRLLYLAAITCLAGTLLGPVQGGTVGYALAYAAGWGGPLVLLVAAATFWPVCWKQGWLD